MKVLPFCSVVLVIVGVVLYGCAATRETENPQNEDVLRVQNNDWPAALAVFGATRPPEDAPAPEIKRVYYILVWAAMKRDPELLDYVFTESVFDTTQGAWIPRENLKDDMSKIRTTEMPDEELAILFEDKMQTATMELYPFDEMSAVTEFLPDNLARSDYLLKVTYRQASDTTTQLYFFKRISDHWQIFAVGQ